MDYKSSNEYTVLFKDGTQFTSSGSADSVQKSSIKNEFEWVAFHIQKEVISAGKTLADIVKVEYVLNYNDK